MLAHGEGRGGASGGHALAVPLGEVTDVLTDAAVLGHHRVGHLRGGQRQPGDGDAEGDLHAEDRVDAELGRVRPRPRRRRGRVEGHDVAGHPVRQAQSLVGDGLGSGRELAQRRDLGVLGGPGPVLVPVGEAVVTEHVRPGG